MKKKFILIFVLVFCSISAQNSFENQKLQSTARIWGFLKYYHPRIALGEYNMDEQFFSILPQINRANDKQELSNVFINWIEKLGIIKECKECQKTSKKNYFEKNFDLSWIQDTLIFTSELSKKLKFIEQNRFKGKKHYYVDTGREGNIIIQNEPKDVNLEYPELNYRLLSLFKFWNTVEYFYPYKYLTDEKWSNVLSEMIPKFYNAKNAQEYHLAMLETVVKINDSHGIFKTKYTAEFFGVNFFPADLKIVDGKAVVIGFLNDSLSKVNDLRIGDVITKIDDRNVEEILHERNKYISASNEKGKLRDTYYTLINGNTKNVKVVLERGNTSTERLINRYSFDDTFKKKAVSEKFKILDNNIGYVNFSSLQQNDTEELIKQLSNTKAIIFDLRNYPNFIPYNIADFLNKNAQPFSKSIVPDLSYPGMYIWNEMKFCGKENKNFYKGRVIILVNENTQSRAEYSTMILQTAPNVITIGSQTAGADGNVSKIYFLGDYFSLISGTGVYYSDGTETQRKGVKIDITVEQTLSAIKLGKDEILEKAKELVDKQ